MSPGFVCTPMPDLSPWGRGRVRDGSSSGNMGGDVIHLALRHMVRECAPRGPDTHRAWRGCSQGRYFVRW